MPTTLEQFRQWLMGAEVEGLPPLPKPPKQQAKPKHPPVKWKRCRRCKGTGDDGRNICPVCDGIGEVPISPSPARTNGLTRKLREQLREGGRGSEKRIGGKYRISATGDDALLLFGKYCDSNVSDIAAKAPSYLEWMLKEGSFSEDLVTVVKIHLAASWSKTRTARWLQLRAMELGMGEADALSYTTDYLAEYILDKM